ncbi:hypothetical protein [Telluribacter sp. SYSU D00476]|uniref:TolB family protein n=1 Tax=Telluribacter sp. SYSU D00476 TaxID=2811430 RepID=UPI001FF30CF1|nr:hypothetical protein [Telluribacter sp. SYSU D00476]
MNRLLTSSLCLTLGLSLSSCIGPLLTEREGKFLSTPVNLEQFNSEFDDYNSNLPSNKHGHDYLIFSSKRDRKEVFNLVLKPFELVYDDKTDKLNARIGSFGWLSVGQNEKYYDLLVRKANQDCNVLGPALYSFDYNIIREGTSPTDKYLLLFADDSKGDLQIKFVHNFNDKNVAEGPFEVSWLNSPQDDAYPTFSSDFSTLYFCSNRGGNFDIFEVALPTDRKQLLETLLSDKPLPVTKNTQLSSPADDKCPHFVQGWWSNTMYLVSNRPGGHGGFDIYHSRLDGTQWSQPQNMGARINTQYDEYRPVTPRNRDHFTYHLGIFSSNRPGGKGGFDLYMAGFLKENETRP